MDEESPQTQPAMGTVRFTLRVEGVNLEVAAPLPQGPVRPQVLLPILQGLSNTLGEMAVRRAAEMGQPLSCREGCGACCRQAVPITAVEARALWEWLTGQPEARRSALLARFSAATRRLEASGVAQRLRAAGAGADRATMHALGLAYFALGIACPFLEDERCSIHPIRPMRCREYLVVSPAGHCAHPETKEIVGIKPRVLLSRVLTRWNASGENEAQPGEAPELILLAQLAEWGAAHPAAEDRVRRTAPEMLQEFLRAFATDAAAPAGAEAEENP